MPRRRVLTERKMNTLYIDLETYSPIPIKQGVYRYAEEAEILLFAYAINDAEVRVWDVTKSREIPDYLYKCLRYAKSICAHNSNFDRVILKQCMPDLINPLLCWRDTMVRALAHGLPGGLEMLSAIYKLTGDKSKDKTGKKLIQLFCKPQKDGTRATRLTHPEQWKQFIHYAGMDIVAMRELDKKLPTWNDTTAERALWYLDQKINDRGFAVDIDLAQKAIEICTAEKQSRDAQTKELTDGAVNAATQRDALLKYILEIHGVTLPDMQISTLTRRLEDPDLPEPVKDLIALRLESAGTSTRKYTTLINSVCSDGRLRGTLGFCRANRTGRWGGQLFQPHNLPRPQFKHSVIETAIEAVKAGAADLMYDNVTALMSSALRGVIVAPPGKKLVVSDLASIEGRVLAWLAGEQWKIDGYKDFDAGIGYDMYTITYAKTFNIDPADVTKEQRQLGKVLELAMGYGGGVGAFVTFANVYGIDLQDLGNKIWPVLPSDIVAQSESYWYVCRRDRKTLGLNEDVFIACDSIKRMWREANALIECFWKQLENDCRFALITGSRTERKRYAVDKKGKWLRIELPSGRFLCYAGAHLDDNKIKYLGVNQYSKKWGKLSTYGGKLAENITQAVSRDILAHGLTGAENAGYEVVLSVHDELITETPDKPEFNHKHLSQIMAAASLWAADLPLAAAGFEAYRYRKD